MIELIDALALLCTAAGLVVGLVVLGARRDGKFALRVALDFWTAAGLLRLAGPPTWQRLAAAAAIPVLRHLLTLSLHARDAPHAAGTADTAHAAGTSHTAGTTHGRSARLRHALRPAWTRHHR